MKLNLQFLLEQKNLTEHTDKNVPYIILYADIGAARNIRGVHRA